MTPGPTTHEPALDPDLLPGLSRALTSFLGPDVADPLAVRALDASLSPRQAPALPDDVEQRTVAIGEQDLEAGIYRPRAGTVTADTALPCVMWFHGGGMIMGSAAASAARACTIVQDVGAVVVVPEYRLAPEHPYPAALEDTLGATRWVADNAAALGVDPGRIGLAGVSAGGNLATAVALVLREDDAVRPAHLHLQCPMLDDRTTLAPAGRDTPVWNSRLNEISWTAYLGSRRRSPDVPATASPARTRSLAGLPPIYLDVGSADLFLAEDLAFVTRAARDGVAVEAHVVPGAYHVWDALVPDARVSREARERRARVWRRALTVR